MALNDLPLLIDPLPGFDALVQSLREQGAAHREAGAKAHPVHTAVAIDGLAGPAKGYALARLFTLLSRPLLIITYQQEQAQRLWEDIVRFGVPQDRAAVLPSSQSQFLEGDITDFRVIGERVGALAMLARREPCIVIGTIEAVCSARERPTT